MNDLRSDFPKILHFVWMGPEMPGMYKKSLRRWKELNSDYDIKLWGGPPRCMPKELKDLVEKLPFYCQKSDIIRYWVVYKYGGMYFDLDEWPYRSIDELRKYSAFTAVQYNGLVACASLGAIPLSEQYEMVVRFCVKRARRGLRGRCDYGPSLLSTPEIRNVFSKSGAVIGPRSWFYIWPPKEKNKCRSFAMSDAKHQTNMITNHRHLYKDGVTPYGVHLWGWEGSSFRKAKQ